MHQIYLSGESYKWHISMEWKRKANQVWHDTSNGKSFLPLPRPRDSQLWCRTSQTGRSWDGYFAPYWLGHISPYQIRGWNQRMFKFLGMNYAFMCDWKKDFKYIILNFINDASFCQSSQLIKGVATKEKPPAIPCMLILPLAMPSLLYLFSL